MAETDEPTQGWPVSVHLHHTYEAGMHFTVVTVSLPGGCEIQELSVIHPVSLPGGQPLAAAIMDGIAHAKARAVQWILDLDGATDSAPARGAVTSSQESVHPIAQPAVTQPPLMDAAGDVSPTVDVPPMPDGIQDVASFLAAMRAELGCDDKEARVRITRLGQVSWRNVVASELERRWRVVLAAP